MQQQEDIHDVLHMQIFAIMLKKFKVTIHFPRILTFPNSLKIVIVILVLCKKKKKQP